MTQVCRSCNVDKPLSSFGKNKRLKLGHKYFCKSCFNVLYNDSRKSWKSKNKDKVKQKNKKYVCHLQNLRRVLKIKATLKWANLDKIKEFYKNCPKEYRVDHIIPLRGKNICGLHIETNLQ